MVSCRADCGLTWRCASEPRSQHAGFDASTAAAEPTACLNAAGAFETESTATSSTDSKESTA